MLRLTLLLSAALFGTLLIAGEDKGQMRPGLARAVANGEEIVTLTRSYSETVVIAPAAEAEPVKLSATDLPPPVELVEAPVIGHLPEPAADEISAPKPVFTLSSLSGLDGDQASLPATPAAGLPDEIAMDPVAEDGTEPPREAADSLYADPWQGDLRVVEASSVNVRLGPSTDTSVVGKLFSGETVRVIGAVDSEWVEISVEGDGVTGYVASRFLTASSY